MIVVLDTGPLGRVSNPRASDLNLACHQWLQSLLRQDIPVFIPVGHLGRFVDARPWREIAVGAAS